MKSLYEVEEYIKEITDFSKSLDKEFLCGKNIAISGTTGLICSYLIDSLLIDETFDIKIIALVLTLEDGKSRFRKYVNDKRLVFVVANIVNPIHIDGAVDYVIHGASYTDPKGYAEHPIDTMLINFNGVKNMLDLAVEKKSTKLLFMSTCEIYGEADIDSIPEDYTGNSTQWMFAVVITKAKGLARLFVFVIRKKKESLLLFQGLVDVLALR